MLRNRNFVGLAVAVLLVATASLALAQSTGTGAYWNVAGPADWSTAGNWVSGPFGGVGAGDQPVWVNTGTVINNGGVATIGAGDNVTDSTGAGYVFVGGSDFLGGSGGNGYVNMTGGTLSGKVHDILGVASGSGIFTQSGGVNIPYARNINSSSGWPTDFTSLELGYSNGGYGEYDLSGGAVGANAVYVGASEYTVFNSTMNAGTGVFNQTGGSVGDSAHSALPARRAVPSA